MAFNREDLITWNELAPSFQTIIRALQSEITHLSQRMNTMRIVQKMSHFLYLFEEHRDSDHPHSGGVNSIMRQPQTRYQVGAIVYDVSLPFGCYLECISPGTTARAFPLKNYDGYISDTECNQYNTIDKVRVRIAELYNLLEEHKLIRDAHPNASDFLIRQKNTYYPVGSTVFDDTVKYITRRLEVTSAGTTQQDNTPISIPDPAIPSDLIDADIAIETLNTELEEHIAESDPHTAILFLTRQPNTVYHIGEEVFIPGHGGRYYLECVQVNGAGTTSSNTLLFEEPEFIPEPKPEPPSPPPILDKNIKITVLDVKNADSILIQTGEQTILVDTGRSDNATKQALFMNALKNYNVTTIDKLIITHPHIDHDGNVAALISPTAEELSLYPQLSKITVKNVYFNGIERPFVDRYVRYFNDCTEKNIPLTRLQAGDELDFGNTVIFKVLWPTEEAFNYSRDVIQRGDARIQGEKSNGNINASSIVGKLIYNQFSMMLTGDCYAPWVTSSHYTPLLNLYSPIDLYSTVLKAAHHDILASHHPPEVLQAISPEYFLVSNSSYSINTTDEHIPDIVPRHQTLVNCLDAGIDKNKIYCTGLNGDISINTDGLSWSVNVQKNADWFDTVFERQEAYYDDIDNYTDTITGEGSGDDDNIDDGIDPEPEPQPEPPSPILSDNTIKITVIAVGSADSILIQTGEQTILIDTGRYDDGGKTHDMEQAEAQRKLFMDALSRYNVTTINKLIITHAHWDHDGNVAALISPTDKELERYPQLANIHVSEVYWNGIVPPAGTNTRYDLYKNLFAEKNIPLTRLQAGDELDFGNTVTFEVLWPTQNSLESGDLQTGSMNGVSIVGRLVYKSFSMLLTGDCHSSWWTTTPKKPRSYLTVLQYYTEDKASALKANIMKAAHHDFGDGQNSEEMLRAVEPKCLINSNKYKMRAVTKAICKKLGITYYSTDAKGDICITTDGTTQSNGLTYGISFPYKP